MHSQILVLVALFCSAWCHDITIGTNAEGRKIFDEIRQANPAIWRQYENVTVIAPDNEVIGRVVITDMRPEKDGDVRIVDGGEGTKQVTIELKSPTVLRGYDFRIEVYAVPETVYTDAEEHLPHEEESVPLNDQNDMTELPENTTGEEVPVVAAKDVNPDSDRPSRESEDESNFQNGLPEDHILASGTAVMDVDNDSTSKTNDEATTQADIPIPDEQSSPVPITFDNTKNVPDDSSLNIFDYIKNKERPSRHTENNRNEPNSETFQTNEADVTTPITEETSSPTDDGTVDLVPPEIDSKYNTDFATSLGTTENSVESSTFYDNAPRAGRGIDYDSGVTNDDEYTPVPTSTTEGTTTTADSGNDNVDNASLDDEQVRNTRDNTNDVDSDETIQDTDVSNEEGKQPNDNVIIINVEELIKRSSNNKFMYTLPIVLVIANENNLPMIKIIAEEASNERDNKPLYPTQPLDEYDYKSAENDKSEDNDFMPSGDSAYSPS